MVLQLLSFVILGKQQAFTPKEGFPAFEKRVCFHSLKDDYFPRKGMDVWVPDSIKKVHTRRSYGRALGAEHEFPGTEQLLTGCTTSGKLLSLSETHFFSYQLSKHYRRMHLGAAGRLSHLRICLQLSWSQNQTLLQASCSAGSLLLPLPLTLLMLTLTRALSLSLR